MLFNGNSITEPSHPVLNTVDATSPFFWSAPLFLAVYVNTLWFIVLCMSSAFKLRQRWQWRQRASVPSKCRSYFSHACLFNSLLMGFDSLNAIIVYMIWIWTDVVFLLFPLPSEFLALFSISCAPFANIFHSFSLFHLYQNYATKVRRHHNFMSFSKYFTFFYCYLCFMIKTNMQKIWECQQQRNIQTNINVNE